jgi:general secretion pathway protein G
MKLTTTRLNTLTRRGAFTLLEVLVVVAIIVILASVATVATTRYLDDAKKTKAQLNAKAISQAIEAYTINPANVNSDPPGSLQDLIQPPFGGQSLLRNGPEDLKTPWNGAEFNLEQHQRQDGTTYYLVWTKAPDGTEVSQFGIGPAARPKF